MLEMREISFLEFVVGNPKIFFKYFIFLYSYNTNMGCSCDMVKFIKKQRNIYYINSTLPASATAEWTIGFPSMPQNIKANNCLININKMVLCGIGIGNQTIRCNFLLVCVVESYIINSSLVRFGDVNEVREFISKSDPGSISWYMVVFVHVEGLIRCIFFISLCSGIVYY
jgi:hypothetical protein